VNAVLDVLNEHVTTASNHIPEQWSWPPREYLLWGFLEDMLYKNNSDIHTQSRTLINVGGSDQGQLRLRSCRRPRTPTVNTPKMCLYDNQSPKNIELGHKIQ
jgi:hypothetical protein